MNSLLPIITSSLLPIITIIITYSLLPIIITSTITVTLHVIALLITGNNQQQCVIVNS